MKPATYPTTVLLTLSLMKAAARFLGVATDLTDHDDLYFGVGVLFKRGKQSMCVVPITGSPPMPTQVVKPDVTALEHHLVGRVPDLDTSPIRPW